MEDLLIHLGWKEKEVRCYLCLLQNGQQPASVISKKTAIPKATVLFVLHNLNKKGYLQMKKKGNTEYFFADPKDLERAKSQEINKQQQLLSDVLPLLSAHQHPDVNPPKLSFFEGKEACKNAYSRILESKTEVHEFATHEDLEDSFGNKWMDHFIKERSRKKIFMKSICHDSPRDRELQPLDKEQERSTRFFPKKKGKMFSCLVIFDDKLLILNLGKEAFGILIENAAIVETMRTIHSLAWNSRSLTRS